LCASAAADRRGCWGRSGVEVGVRPRRSRGASTSGGSARGRAPAARPCLTASTPAPISPPAVGTPRCGVL